MSFSFSLFSAICVSLLMTQSTDYIISRDISYGPDSRNKLDQYKPQSASLGKVLIFVHGGSWTNGSKDMYVELGKTFARHGIETLVINYRLAPGNNYSNMASDVTQAVAWAVKNCRGEIYLMGHSAGAHLAALVCSDTRYFQALQLKDPVKGVIVDDAFGLDLNDYFAFISSPYAAHYIPAFGRDESSWKDASPILHVARGNTTKFLVLSGSNTYKPIKTGSRKFYEKLKKESIAVTGYVIAGKGHQEMITGLKDDSDSLTQKIYAFLK